MKADEKWLREQGARRPMEAAGIVTLVLGKWTRTEGKETGTYPVRFSRRLDPRSEHHWWHYTGKLSEAPEREDVIKWVEESCKS